MTLRSPEEALNCVKSTLFTEVELTHHWTLQPPLVSISRVIDPGIYTIIDPPWGMVI